MKMRVAGLVQRTRLKSGEGGIRTHGGVTPTPVFETGLFNRSSTSPKAARGTVYATKSDLWRGIGLLLFCFTSRIYTCLHEVGMNPELPADIAQFERLAARGR